METLIYILTYLGLLTGILICFRINKPMECENGRKEVRPLFIDLYELDAEIEELIKEENYFLN